MSLEQIAATIEAFPLALAELLAPIDESVLSHKNSVEDWCVLEIIGHLIDGDKFAFRGRIAEICEGIDEISPVDPGEAIGKRDYCADSLEKLLAEFKRERAISAEFVRSLDSKALENTANFKHYGEFKALDFVYEWPYHDQDHLQQILSITKASYLPQMSPTMRNALS